ncbi:MAG: calcium-translocating P-type ATPase, PMCA-type [Bacteroidales bacterium]|nr:calcium-translocating P-type ATPase, PMCA-type [Bacteroidales bacterium]
MKQNRQIDGLNNTQVLENRKLFGSNIIAPPAGKNSYSLLLKKFTSPLIMIMLLTMLLSFATAIYQTVATDSSSSVFYSPVGILLAILISTLTSFMLELRTKRRFELLNKEDEAQSVKVLRNGNFSIVSRNDIVVGDVVLLEVGDEVPADGILLEAVALHVNESALTGELLVGKTTDSSKFDMDATYPSDRVLRGTIVTDGHGTMKVTMVGDRTEYGKVFHGAQVETEAKSPLTKQLKSLNNLIATISYAVAILFLVGRGILFFVDQDSASLLHISKYFIDSIMIAVTIIIVMIPEGLSLGINLSLTLNMRQMLTTQSLIRNMQACETIGAATVICTDKTGTLTRNQMRVNSTYIPCINFKNLKENERAWDALVKNIAVNSTANLNITDSGLFSIGNPTEAALLIWLIDHCVDYRTIRSSTQIHEQCAFSTEKKYMATVIHTDNPSTDLLLVKGAPEIIIGMSAYFEVPEGAAPFEPALRQHIELILLEYQLHAMRTLAFAYKVVKRSSSCFDDNGELLQRGLTMLGVMAIVDPIRPDVSDAVKECISAGIKIKIVTGDTPATALEVGRQTSILSEYDTTDCHVTGAEFSAMNEEDAYECAKRIKIMSRARPMDKLRLVKLLQKHGEVVAVTGDGTNDAPALNAAAVGLSMGNGSAVAKQASDITILDNSFHSINRAVLYGRALFRNIQRFLLFQLTINFTAGLVVLLGTIISEGQITLTITQMLWVNMIMNTFASIALVSLPPEEQVMTEAPRRNNDNIIPNGIRNRIIASSVGLIVIMLAILHYFKCNNIIDLSDVFTRSYRMHFFTYNPNGTLTPYELSAFFSIFVLIHLWNLFNMKAFRTYRSVFTKLEKTSTFHIIVAAILIGQILIVTFGGKLFNVVSLSFTDWLIIIGVTSIILVVGEVFRFFRWLMKKHDAQREQTTILTSK